MFANHLHLLLDGLVIGVAVWCIAVGLHLSRVAIGGYHLELCAWAVVPLLVADELALEWGVRSPWFVPAATLVVAIGAGAVFLLFAQFITAPLWRRTFSPAAVLVASFAAFQLILATVKTTASSAAARVAVEERFLGPNNVLTNHHLLSLGFLSLVVGAWWALRRTRLPAAVLLLEQDRDQLIALGYPTLRYCLMALSLAILLAVAGGFLFSLVHQPLTINNSYHLLLLAFACTIFFPRRNKLLPIVAAASVGLIFSLGPLAVSGKYALALLGMAMIGASILNSVRFQLARRTGEL